MPERRLDSEARDRIDRMEQRLQRRVTIIMAIQVAVLVALLAASFYFRGQQSDQTRRGERLALGIQQSRVENVLRSCLQDTARNKATIAQYDRALADRLRLASPAERQRLAESRAFFVQLVDAFLPKQSPGQCQRLAAEQTRIPLDGGGS